MFKQGMQKARNKPASPALKLFGLAFLTAQVGFAANALGAENIIADPQFESGVSGFLPQDDSSTVQRSSQSPLEGASSLRISISGWGNNIWWTESFAGGLASRLFVSAHLRSDVASSSTLQFCATAYYQDDTSIFTCVPVSGSVGDKGVVSAETVIDETKRLKSLNIRLSQEGSAPLTFTLDDAVANVDVIEAPPPGGGSGPGLPPPTCTVLPPGQSAYPGFTYSLPVNRPFISLAHYAQPDLSSTAYTRFKAAADSAVAGNPPYNYSAAHSVMMFRITGNATYIDDAISRVEAFVSAAEAAAASGEQPVIADDSYLHVGWYMEQLALAYDYGFQRLTDQQRQRWAAFAERSLQNLWHPAEAKWGNTPRPWSGWGTCDPGNNYHFSFLKATMLWALAAKSTEWLNFLQEKKFPPLIDFYSELPGGGTREGTGYGAALRDLFENYIYWKDSTGEDLAALTPHPRESIDYWINATVPTRDRFAPIGDQSRVSVPALFDYHENLVHEAVVLNPGTPEAQRGTWWLQNNSVNGVEQAFNLHGDLLPLPDSPTIPTERVYYSSGAGALFARSGWDTNASWLSFIAGKYDQSHAHQDQGSFTFFKNDWLAVTSNIWSNSGIHQEVEIHNGIRFERSNGSVIAQRPTSSTQSTLTYSTSGGTLNASANLSNAYWNDSNLVQSWTRSLQYSGNTLRVTDACSVASGVRPVFQVHVPVQPALQQDGSVVAGNLRIVPLQGVATPEFIAMPGSEYSRGYRIDFTSTAGCSFNFELRAQ